MWDLVGNPEDRFSHKEAQTHLVFRSVLLVFVIINLVASMLLCVT